MNALNSLILEGTITDDVKVNTICNGISGEFTLETKRNYKNHNGENVEEKSTFTVYCYGEIANLMQLHSKKGQGVKLVGRLKQERWTDTDGKMFTKIVVIAEHIELKPFVKKSAQYETGGKIKWETEQ